MAYVKVSGGIFLDMTIHDFDTARYLMGSEVEEVCGRQRAGRSGNRQGGDLDTAVMTLRFANGALGVIDNSRQAVYGYDPARRDALDRRGWRRLRTKRRTRSCTVTPAAVHTTKPLYFFLERYGDAFAEMREFVRAVLQASQRRWRRRWTDGGAHGLCRAQIREGESPGAFS